MNPEPMSDEERDSLIEDATRFGRSVGGKFPRWRDDVVGAALLGAAVAFASPDLPGDREGRQKFVGQTVWNLIRRELTFFTRPQPVPFTDLGVEGDVGRDAPDGVVEWRDEFEAVAALLAGRTAEVFRVAYGPGARTHKEIGQQVGLSGRSIQKHADKIRGVLRRRHKRGEHLA